MKSSFKTFLILGSITYSLLGCIPDLSEHNASRPNILFIMSDDHTSQAWGIYGGVLQDYVQNANIKRLAREGAVLKNVFCTNSICVPSRGSILTGQYSHQNEILTLVEGLHPDSLNIAKVMKVSGYQTALFGKWHLKQKPAGFDDFMVLPGQGRYKDPLFKNSENWQDGNKGGREIKGFSADVITDLSIDWLKERSNDSPFFLMTHFKSTHEPFDYPERMNGLYSDEIIPEPLSLYDFGPEKSRRTFDGQNLEILAQRYIDATVLMEKGKRSRYPGLPFPAENLDSTELRRRAYQKFVKDFMRCGAAIDDNIGRLLDYLDQNNLAQNTVVIYTSDQGYFLGEHGFFDKRMMYEESLRMPFVIRYPKEIQSGSKVDDIVLNIDFASLFADYAGIENSSFRQGHSFRSNLKGKTLKNWRKSMYYRYWAHTPRRPAHLGIRNHRYKLMFMYGQHLGLKGANVKENTEPKWEFYDLEVDPNENRNAYNDERYKEVIGQLKIELSNLKKAVGDRDEGYPEMRNILTEHELL